MTAPQFVDTNILLYAISTAADEAEKTREAHRLLDGDDLALSVQVRDDAARHIQHERFPLWPTAMIHSNAEMTRRHMRRACELDA